MSHFLEGFPGSSADKESTCSVGGSILGWEDVLVQSLGWEDPLGKGRLPTPVFWPGEPHGLYGPWVTTTERLSLSFTFPQDAFGLRSGPS